MEKKELTLLIQKYLAGRCTPEEAQRVEQWWEAALEDDRSMNALTREEQDAIQRQMLTNINMLIRQREMKISEPEKSGVAKDNVRTLISWRYAKLAAACSMLIIIASAIFLQVVRPGDGVKITSAYGERREVTLPDGSTVVLNGNSSLRYAEWHENQERKVWLTGEAFFSVKHTVNHNRFVVYTPDSLMIEVLGTQFSVNNRNGMTDVVLQEGKVKLADARAFYIMKPDEMVSYSKDQQQFITKTVNAQQKTAWKDNLLIYHDESIGSIIEKLADSHGLKVVFENEAIKEEIFNGSVPADSVSLFLDKINKLYDARVTQEQDGSYVIR